LSAFQLVSRSAPARSRLEKRLLGTRFDQHSGATNRAIPLKC
jgi:hypothetical protein